MKNLTILLTMFILVSCSESSKQVTISTKDSDINQPKEDTIASITPIDLSQEDIKLTTWFIQLYKNCFDTIWFKTNSEYNEYQCEMQDLVYGTYSIQGDEIILTELGWLNWKTKEKKPWHDVDSSSNVELTSKKYIINRQHLQYREDGIYYIKRTENNVTVWTPEEDWVYKQIK